MMTADKLTDRIKAAIPDAVVEALDTMGDAQHWRVVVTSPEFTGMSRLERHKRVMSSVGGLIPDQIHAIEIKPFAPGEVGS